MTGTAIICPEIRLTEPGVMIGIAFKNSSIFPNPNCYIEVTINDIEYYEKHDKIWEFKRKHIDLQFGGEIRRR